ncbi:serine aminopeptidase domain-containing protein [Methylocucumis oryzae]|uniref:serine aminopeptidase domain-containing protein n=1 Tax=Methylocucumis oryzae TaxID=1632867 RepID=UPI000AA51F4F|nr:alpha/beta hydrolase [Methylocucumis oryzae]
MLKAFSSDPLVIKLTRVETISGLSDLMDLAQHQAPNLNTRTLLLYGAHDEIIPLKPTQQFIQQLDLSNKTIGYYADGYHMLLRDLNAEPRWRDLLAWIQNQQTALPSGADVYAKQTLLNQDSASQMH